MKQSTVLIPKNGKESLIPPCLHGRIMQQPQTSIRGPALLSSAAIASFLRVGRDKSFSFSALSPSRLNVSSVANPTLVYRTFPANQRPMRILKIMFPLYRVGQTQLNSF
jgi:hypothetical protein